MSSAVRGINNSEDSQNHLVRLGLIIATLSYLLSFFHRIAPAAISGDLQLAYGIGGAQLGTLAATYFYVYTVMQIPTGILADTFGPRRILFFGGLVAGFGSIVFAMAPSFAWAAVGRTLVGLGVSVTFIAMLKLIALGFVESRFATLTGLCMLLGNLGSILAGAPLAWVTQIIGWREVFLFVGLISVVLAFASRAWVMDREFVQVDRSSWVAGLRQVLCNRSTWPGFFSNMGLAGAFFTFAGLWAVPYFIQMHGMSKATASSHVSLYFFGFALGALVWGQLSDFLGKRRPVMLFASGVHLMGWIFWLSLAIGEVSVSLVFSYFVCFAMGLGSAGFTLSWACAKEVNPPALSGMATSVVNVGVFFGPALLQPGVGWLMELDWAGRTEAGVRIYSAVEWERGIVLMAVSAGLGLLSALFVKETFCRNVSEHTEKGAV